MGLGRLTILADRLVTTGRFVAVQEELVTDWAMQFIWYLACVERADGASQSIIDEVFLCFSRPT